MKYFIQAFKNWNDFKGRANRSEYWYFVLFSSIISLILSLIDMKLLGFQAESPTSTGTLDFIYSLLVFIPSLSLTVRRLHDVNNSGWNILWAFTIIGIFYLLYLEIKKGTETDNKYGAPSNA